ncbi:MAG: hypothetical protein ACTSRU_19635 [Candidatus Hodarchaeales archaeon]
MSEPSELILTIKDVETIKDVSFNRSINDGLTITVSIGRIEAMTLMSKAVLSIKFSNGELLLDIDENELKKIEYKE